MYKDFKKHEEFIIQDNIEYGLLHNYTDQEISDYKKEAYAQLKDLKKQIRDNPKVILLLERSTERYVGQLLGH